LKRLRPDATGQNRRSSTWASASTSTFRTTGDPAQPHSHSGRENKGLTMEAQIFGTKKCSETRKAQRFFAERRVRVHFVDLAQRAASRGELLRFAQKFGIDALIDRDSKRFKDLGLGAAHLSEQRWLEKLADEPLLLRTPLVRSANRLTIGYQPDTWTDWLSAP
jgi:Spx/MgsR family transcriptional regulator